MAKNILDMHALAKENNIIFLSDKYTGMQEKHLWECKKCSFQWKAKPNNIKFNSGSGCPFCAGKCYNEDFVREQALKRGFQLLTNFTKMTSKVLWKCNDGHEWSCSPFSVITRGTGCPKCNVNINEEKCRFIFESLTGFSFPKNTTILDGLELDGFCEKLKIAFEYHGEQHYQKMYFHNKFRNLTHQQSRDQHKRMLCENKGIYLVEIPYTEKISLVDFISSKLNDVVEIGSVDMNKFIFQSRKLNDLKNNLKDRNIRCLSNSFLGVDSKLKLECLVCFNRWSATPYHLTSKKPTGCPKCGIIKSAQKRRKSNS